MTETQKVMEVLSMKLKMYVRNLVLGIVTGITNCQMRHSLWVEACLGIITQQRETEAGKHSLMSFKGYRCDETTCNEWIQPPAAEI